jgi:lipopolysaccharide export LptBFGC system permease protein LptF
MSRNTLLFLSAILAVIVGLSVSYLPPTKNAEAIWSIVSIFFGYAIKELFMPSTDAPATPAAPVPPVQPPTT